MEASDMTHEYFEKLADILRELIGPVNGETQRRVVAHFVKHLSVHDDFDAEQFVARCRISYKGGA